MAFVSQFVPAVRLLRGVAGVGRDDSSTSIIKGYDIARVPRAAVSGVSKLTPQDREYVNKVRERLLHTKRGSGDKVRTRAYEQPGDVGPEFGEAMRLFNTGQYTGSVALFRSAAEANGGYKTTRGGKVALWLAQALDASGQRNEAVYTLECIIRAHPDPEVAATAAELLFIVTAPVLQVPKDQFIRLPTLADYNYNKKKKNNSNVIHTKHLAGSGLARRVITKKPPEKYSLEWYASQPRRTRREINNDHDPALDSLLFSAVVIGAITALFGYSATFHP